MKPSFTILNVIRGLDRLPNPQFSKGSQGKNFNGNALSHSEGVGDNQSGLNRLINDSHKGAANGQIQELSVTNSLQRPGSNGKGLSSV